MNIDDTLIKHVGQFGRYQCFVCVLLVLAGIPMCLVVMDTIFITAKPKFWCSIPQPTDGPAVNLSHEAWLNLSIPWRLSDGEWQTAQCQTYTWNSSTGEATTPLSQEVSRMNGGGTCDQFKYDTSIFQSTIITEWNLVCKRGYLVSVLRSVSMAGVMAGAGMAGPAADRIGRRMVLVCGITMLFIGRVVLVFAPSLIFYAVANFIALFFSSAAYVTVFTLVVELVGPRWRAVVGSGLAETYGLGFLVLALAAYVFRSWRHLNIAIAVIVSPFLSFIFIIPESPRWLLASGRPAECKRLLATIARRNGRSLPEEFIIMSEKEPENKVSVWSIFSSRILMVRMFLMCLAWFVAAFTYYGLTLNVGSLAGDIYINLILVGLLEMAAYALSQCSVSTRLGRRLATCVLYVVAGFSLLLIIAVPKDKPLVVTVLSLLGRFCVAAYFNCIYIWMAELFPTNVRTSTLTLASCIGKVGGILAPFVDHLGDFHPVLPSVTYGSLSTICGLILLILPETRGKHLPQTVEDIQVLSSDEANGLPIPTTELENLNA